MQATSRRGVAATKSLEVMAQQATNTTTQCSLFMLLAPVLTFSNQFVKMLFHNSASHAARCGRRRENTLLQPSCNTGRMHAYFRLRAQNIQPWRVRSSAARFAEVSCRDVVRQARLSRYPSKGMKALAAVQLKKSESGAHRVFREFGQSVPVKISRVDLPTKMQYPYIKFSSWLRYLVTYDFLDQLVGVKEGYEPTLSEFGPGSKK